MSLDLEIGLLGLGGTTGGVLEDSNTGPVTVGNGVTVNGGLNSLLGGLVGTPLSPKLLGAGIASETAGASLTNAGNIIGSGVLAPALGLGNSAASGVLMQLGGTVLNQSGATISGPLDGVITHGVSSVTNLGTITASAADGIGINLRDGGVVVNAGIVSGSAGANPAVAINLGAGGSTLTLSAGEILHGIARAAGTHNTLNLAAGSGINTIEDLGTTLTGFDAVDVASGVTAAINNGITGVLSDPTTVMLGTGSTLSVGGPVSAGVSLDLTGAGASLTLNGPVAAGASVDLGAQMPRSVSAILATLRAVSLISGLMTRSIFKACRPWQPPRLIQLRVLSTFRLAASYRASFQLR